MRPIKTFGRKVASLDSSAAAVSAFLSDAGAGDSTAQAVLGKDAARHAAAFILANEPGVLAGIPEAMAVFRAAKVRAMPLLKEGARFGKGAKIFALGGSAGGIISAERTALDCLMVLSGIATRSAALKEKHGPRFAATRKTHAGLAAAEKRAVAAGGGLTHRLSLGDAIVIKDNYVDVLAKDERIPYLKALEQSVKRAVSFRKAHKTVSFVEAEARNLREALVISRAGADAVMLDNFSLAKFKAAAGAVRKIRKGIIIEASGGITDATAGKYLAAGADFVSMGSLTLYSRPIDMSLGLVS